MFKHSRKCIHRTSNNVTRSKCTSSSIDRQTHHEIKEWKERWYRQCCRGQKKFISDSVVSND